MTTIAEQLAAEIAEAQAAEFETDKTTAPQAPSAIQESVATVGVHPDEHRPAGLLVTGMLACLGLVAGIGAANLAGATADAFPAVVMSESQQLLSPVDATIQAIQVRDGQAVADGDALVVLRTDESAENNRLQQQLAELKHRLGVAVANVELDTRLKSEQIDAAIHSIMLRSAEMSEEPSDHQVNGFQNSEVQVSATISRDSVNSSSAALNAKVKLCDDRIAQLKKLKSELPKRIRNAHGISQLEQQIEAVEASMEESKQVRLQSVRVTGEGVVNAVECQVGSEVTRGQRLLSIADPSTRFLDMHVSSDRINEIKPGSRFKITFPGGAECEAAIRERIESRPGTDGEVIIRLHEVGELWPTLPNGTRVSVVPIVK